MRKQVQKNIIVGILIVSCLLFLGALKFLVIGGIQVCEGDCTDYLLTGVECTSCEGYKEENIKVCQQGQSCLNYFNSVSEYCNAWNRPSNYYSKESTCTNELICPDNWIASANECCGDKPIGCMDKRCVDNADKCGTCGCQGTTCSYNSDCCPNQGNCGLSPNQFLKCISGKCTIQDEDRCGDGICDSNENSAYCPEDCYVYCDYNGTQMRTGESKCFGNLNVTCLSNRDVTINSNKNNGCNEIIYKDYLVYIVIVIAIALIIFGGYMYLKKK